MRASAAPGSFTRPITKKTPAARKRSGAWQTEREFQMHEQPYGDRRSV